jgi:hypothetical protein
MVDFTAKNSWLSKLAHCSTGDTRLATNIFQRNSRRKQLGCILLC